MRLVFVIVPSFPDQDTRIGVETLELKLIKSQLEKSEMPIASQSIPSHTGIYKIINIHMLTSEISS